MVRNRITIKSGLLLVLAIVIASLLVSCSYFEGVKKRLQEAEQGVEKQVEEKGGIKPSPAPQPTPTPTPSPREQDKEQPEQVSKIEKASTTPARVRVENGIARTVRATLPVPASAGDKPEDKARAILDDYKDLYGLDNVDTELKVTEIVRTDDGKEIVSFVRVVDSVPVFASGVKVHIQPDNTVTFISAGLPTDADVPTDPKLSKEEAIVQARKAAQVGDDEEVLDTELVVFNEGMITGEPAKSALAWMVTLDVSDPPGEQVIFIDAISGEVVFSYDDLQDARKRFTYSAKNLKSKWKITHQAASRELWFTEEGQAPNTQVSADGRKAHEYAAKIYDYFKKTFGRDSYDGKGGTVRSFVHYSTTKSNAFWSSKYKSMFFMENMVALDVFAHEFTHAVTRSTANLVYAFQSGALNESFSDVFAAFVEDWAGEPGAWEMGRTSKELPLMQKVRCPSEALRTRLLSS
jgi:Zn-dependent metalloprotease